MAMDTRVRLQTLLNNLEQELQQLNWWELHAPSLQALQSQQPFCVDTLNFSQWLQWVFVPRMHAIISTNQPLPGQCAIHAMAEVVYRDQLGMVEGLLDCLKSIDAAISTPHTLH